MFTCKKSLLGAGFLGAPPISLMPGLAGRVRCARVGRALRTTSKDTDTCTCVYTYIYIYICIHIYIYIYREREIYPEVPMVPLNGTGPIFK